VGIFTASSGVNRKVIYQTAQGGYGCPIPGGVQGQGAGQPGLVLDVEVGGPACSRGVGAS